jgi:hypothetical protein
MKKIITLILLIIFCNSDFIKAQQTESLGTDSVRQVISVFGKPAGNAINKKIGKEGGTISSEDGQVEVIFPEGALKKKTDISIQSVSNTMPGGHGKAYHLQPSGIEFLQPADIIFHYTSDELSGNNPSLFGIAMQDEKGQWHGLRDFALDTINKTIKGSIRHFSYWVNYLTASITPASKRLKVNKELLLQINSFTTSNDDNDELSPLTLVTSNVAPLWTVNSIPNGNSATGTLRTNSQVLWASLYKAPASVPERNPVAVTAEIKALSFRIANHSYSNLKLTSNILIYDNAYEVKMESWNDNTSAGICTMRMVDSGSFVVQMDGSKPKVIDIQNNLLQQPVKSGCPCTFVWMNQAICNGPIHIAPVQMITLVPGTPYNQVKIMFQPMFTMIPVFRYICPQSNGTTSGFSMPAIPRYIEFYTKNEQQVIMENGDRSNGFRMTVNPVRED